ncbi:MAG TPA: hypothetical protein VMU04_22060 [Candidatus Acidoferrum sp.]|nr:hypothetical protein [Candidatus Acidoferrum sp.]
METSLNAETPSPGPAARWRPILPILVAVLIALSVMPLSRAPLDLKVDTDTSLSAVLNYAHQHRLQYGPELVYTYGPLGYLVFFYYWPHEAGLRLAVQAALSLTAALGVCLVAWRLGLIGRCLLLGSFVFAAANLETRTDLLFYVGLLCWGLLCFVESGRRLAPVATVLAVLTAFGALVKASIFFGAGTGLVLLAGTLALRGKLRVAVGILAGFAMCAVLGWVASGQDLRNVGVYLVNALALVRGYSQGLGWEGMPGLTPLGVAALMLALAAASLACMGTSNIQHPTSNIQCQSPRRRLDVGCSPHPTWSRALLLSWLTWSVFVTWKHGLARGDVYHPVHFFAFIGVLALAVLVLPGAGPRLRLAAGAAGLLACLISLLTLQTLFFLPSAQSLQQPFRTFAYNLRSVLRPDHYCRRMDAIVAERRDEARLPEISKRIGKATVDVFGQNQAYAVLNDLNFHPRPVFQSYVACTPQLMALNEQFYLSPAAPQYVIFNLGPQDRRFAPLEDSLALRHLLLNYEPAGSEGGFLLLKARSAAPCAMRLVREGNVLLGERIDVSGFGDTNLWLQIALEPSTTGLLREVFYRSPTVRLTAWPEPGKRLLTRRRAPAPMLCAGFVASPLLQRNQDVLDLYAGKPRCRPAAYSVEVLPGREYLWKQPLHYRVYSLDAPHFPRAFPDSAASLKP